MCFPLNVALPCPAFLCQEPKIYSDWYVGGYFIWLLLLLWERFQTELNAERFFSNWPFRVVLWFFSNRPSIFSKKHSSLELAVFPHRKKQRLSVLLGFTHCFWLGGEAFLVSLVSGHSTHVCMHSLSHIHTHPSNAAVPIFISK